LRLERQLPAGGPVSLRRATAVLLLGAAAVASALAQQPLLIGVTTPLTGPDAAYGQGLRHGSALAVARANAAGGVAGRPLALQVLDDGGDPARAAANVRQLLERGAVALTGVHGARSTAAVADVLATAGQTSLAALVGPATSADCATGAGLASSTCAPARRRRPVPRCCTSTHWA
jgi:branched-chain amino acid transport system substrate-binding protein